MRAEWERNAAWWQGAFTEGADPEYEEQILPLVAERLGGCRRVLEVGTGEGQVARRLSAAGAEVVGVEPSAAQVETARRRGGGPCFARADATGLPFPAGAFDGVVACLVLEHVPDLQAAIGELARVLSPSGKALLLLNHPLFQAPGSGWIDDYVLGEQYWRVGAYLEERRIVEEVAKDVFVTFYHRPLERWVGALLSAGLVVTGLEEPPPPPGFLALAKEYEEAATIPRLLVLSAEHRRPACENRGP
jgi:SAM-dependent methyltransferase